MYTLFLNRRLNLKKKSMISKSIFKDNAVSIKIPKDGGREFNKLILSFTEQRVSRKTPRSRMKEDYNQRMILLGINR